MRLKDDAVYGVEALLRWTHPTRGSISPVQFIPLAEETGLIIPIGLWVLQEACREAKRIDEHFTGTEPIAMSVNLSVKQLQDEHIVEDVRQALEATGLEPSRLVLEITESVMIADAELAIERLLALKQIGVRLAMDDFGTGYSSLSYLSRFPVDILKMDRSFLSSDKVDSGLAAAIVGLGETLKVDVVAEGIELATQTESLRDLGCKLGQGFLFAKAMHPDALAEYLRTQMIVDAPDSEAA
jgi:EAL domain-containing protein (putative c-di-GMP-specific phosphodiesterase class I)